MEWQEYYRTYLAFDLAINQACVMAKAAHNILEDFPNRLPKEWQDKIKAGTGILAAALQEIAQDESRERRFPAAEVVRRCSQITDTYQSDAPGIVRPLLDSYLNACALGYPKSDLRFNEHVYVQQLVMVFAYLDAFIADSVRAICLTCPDILKSSKKIDWETVISAGDWESVLQMLIEKYVYQFGFDGVVKRVSKMRKQFGLGIDLDERILMVLEAAELARNLFVHNGGRVNQEFIDRTKALDLKMSDEMVSGHEWIRTVFISSKGVDRVEAGIRIGDRLLCDDRIADGTAEYARIVGGEVFSSISVKFYGKDEAALTGVTRQSGHNLLQE